MPKRDPSRCFRLVPLAAVLTGGLGCKTTPPLIEDIGAAVDRGAKKVVDAFDGRSLPPPEDSEEEAATRARDAYEEGKLAYQTAQYFEALDKFLEAFKAAEEIEDSKLKAEVQSSLYYNLGSTHLRAYDLDNDRAHLAQAKALLQNYIDADPNLTEEERAQAENLMGVADQKLAEAEAESEASPPSETSAESESAEPAASP